MQDMDSFPIDRIEFAKWLGRGSFGNVFQGKINQLSVAVKLALEPTTSLKNEAKRLQKCQHPYIVRFLCRAAFIYYGVIHSSLVLEYATEGSLWKFYRERQRYDKVSLESRVQILCQIAEGCRFLHQMGIRHNDLKSDNVLITVCNGQFVAKIADLGSGDHLATTQPTQSEVVTTRVYSAPERWKTPVCLLNLRFNHDF
ncbi:kinase-like domain-containing protein [Zopfochytrium polystomum]|nr:kinase-like domain-containing protein [Zopfochytrium polystomum]